jgi:hypothetical protein
VIIVATRGTRPLPKRLVDCIEGALAKKGPARIGLVVVLEQTDQRAKDTMPAYRQLQAISRKAKVRFFSLPWGNLAEVRSAEENAPFAPTLIVDGSFSIGTGRYRAWGINE